MGWPFRVSEPNSLSFVTKTQMSCIDSYLIERERSAISFIAARILLSMWNKQAIGR